MAENRDNFKIMIDQHQYEWSKSTITGLEIKKLAGVDPSFGVWRDLPGPNDPPVGDNEEVDLKEHGENRFFTGRKTTTEGAQCHSCRYAIENI